MTHAPNRHVIRCTVTDAKTGASYLHSDPHSVIVGEMDVAETALAHAKAQAAKPLPDGWFRICYYSDHHLFSWYETEMVWAPPPLSGPEWDKAWDEGPGANP